MASVLMHSDLTDVTIANGASTSRWVSSDSEYHDAVSITIRSPTGLEANTFVFETCDDGAGTNISVIQAGNPAADLGPPAAAKTRIYFELPRVKWWRIKNQTGNVGSLRTFKVSKSWRA